MVCNQPPGGWANLHRAPRPLLVDEGAPATKHCRDWLWSLPCALAPLPAQPVMHSLEHATFISPAPPESNDRMHLSKTSTNSWGSLLLAPVRLTPLQSTMRDMSSGNSSLSIRSSAGPSAPRNARPGFASSVDMAELSSTDTSAVETAASASTPRAIAQPPSTAPRAIGSALTDAIQSELASRWPSRYCHVDDNALVLNTVPSSEDRQKKLIRLTIESAQRFAILTSYSINPAKDPKPGNVSGTTFAMLEALARKQHDKDFTFVLFYNENKLLENSVIATMLYQNVVTNMSLKSEANGPRTTTWPAVIEAYNRQQTDDRLRIGSVKCGIYFVAAKAKGLAGSHHNKFCVNDQGIAATLGASIANRTKDNWMDGGCITVSSRLATSQRDYFLSDLLGGHSVKCAQMRMDGERPTMSPVKDLAPIRALADIDVRSPLDLEGPGKEAAVESFRDVLSSADVPLEGTRHKVLWIQNPSDSAKNMLSARGRIEDKPIGHALSRVFRSAEAGETIDLACGRVGTEAFALIGKALSKGCNVNILINKKKRALVERRARCLYANSTTMPPGQLTVREYAPNEHLMQQQSLGARQMQGLHAKNYVLTRNNGSYVVMTGTYNLDGQSHYRSTENLMMIETKDTALRKALFDELHEGSEVPSGKAA